MAVTEQFASVTFRDEATGWGIITVARHSPKNSVHGPRHWRRVERNGLLLATRSGANIAVVRLFALFHDSRRQKRTEGARGMSESLVKSGCHAASDGERYTSMAVNAEK